MEKDIRRTTAIILRNPLTRRIIRELLYCGFGGLAIPAAQVVRSGARPATASADRYSARNGGYLESSADNA